MNSTELIALAERRYAELGGAERAGEWRSWYRGFLEGFMSLTPNNPPLPLVKELREALADELSENGLSWERHVHLFACADEALEEEK